MPTILLLCEYATLNGGERSMLATLPALLEEGYSIHVAAPAEGALADELRARGIDVIPLQATDEAGRRRSQDELRRQLAVILSAQRPDLLHANSLAMGRLAGPVARELRVPSLAHLRDILRLSAQAVEDLNCNDRLLAVSEAARAFHVAQGLPSEKVQVLHNGVDLAEFRPRLATGYLHRELGIPPDSRLIATIGQIGLRKGQDVLLQAVPKALERFPEVHFLIVGERNSGKEESRAFEAKLRRAANATAGHVHFLGRRDDMPRLLNELTLLVHPARQEPLGRVLLEAAASGVAVVATDVGGTAEIFPPDAAAARLVPPNDAGSLALAIAELLEDESQRLSLAAAARRRAESGFDAADRSRHLARHYRQLLHS